MVMPRSLNEPVGLRPSYLSHTSAPTPLGQGAGADERRPALEQGDDRRRVRDGEVLPVLLDEAAPGHHEPSTRRSVPTRSTTSSERSSVMHAWTSRSRAWCVTKTMRAPDARALLLHRLDGDAVAAHHAGDRGEHARPVGDLEVKVVRRGELVDGPQAARDAGAVAARRCRPGGCAPRRSGRRGRRWPKACRRRRARTASAPRPIRPR